MSFVAVGVGVVGAAATVGSAAMQSSAAGKGAKTAQSIANGGDRASRFNQAQAVASVSQAQNRRVKNERDLAFLTNALGTPEQLSDMAAAKGISPYTGRYQQEDVTKYFGDFTQGVGKSGKQLEYYSKAQTAYNAQVATANAHMQKAEEAAKRGDFAEAERRKALAANVIRQTVSGGGNMTKAAGGGAIQFTPNQKLTGDTSDEIDRLLSPEGQIVGSMVKEGRDLMNRTGSYNEIYDALTTGALTELEGGYIKGERALAAEQRAAQRQARDLGASRGAARSLSGEAALSDRLSDAMAMNRANLALDTATQKAKTISDAKKFLEGYRTSFSQNSVAFAEAWAAGSPGIREQFQGAMDNLTGMLVETYNKGADRSVQQGSYASRNVDTSGGSQVAGILASIGGNLLGSSLAYFQQPGQNKSTGSSSPTVTDRSSSWGAGWRLGSDY